MRFSKDDSFIIMNTHKIVRLQHVPDINCAFILYQNYKTLSVMNLYETQPTMSLSFDSKLGENTRFNSIVYFDYQPKDALLYLSVDTKMILVFRMDFDVLGRLGIDMNSRAVHSGATN